MGSHTSTVSRKNMTVINFARCHVQIRVSIGFSCTVSEIQNTFFLVSKDNVFCKRFVQRSFVYTSHRLKPEVT
ncbi:hypothetical protein BHM03_00063050 [Ensete ventricosum]|nr:hypothetical protein BHM03_00063050 [Ensete ventricosum]